MSDGDLLERFAALQDETAFGVMVRRHGGVVLQVCRTLLSNPADVEDAFQATFLVLARQAHAIRKKCALASWLYGVAYRTCLKARATLSVRRHHEMQRGAAALLKSTAGVAEATGTCPRFQSAIVDDLTWREARCILHEELARLPEKYRAPLVLCYLEGRRQDEAERLLGWPAGKLRSMLERARHRFRAHLIKRGLGPSLVLLLAAGEAKSAALPQSLLRASIQQARPGIGAPSQRVQALAEAVTRCLTPRPGKLALCIVLLASLAGAIAAGLAWPALAEEPPPPAAQAPPGAVLLAARTPQGSTKKTLAQRITNVESHASDWWEPHAPHLAFNPVGSSMWNAGNYAPQWIEADLGRSFLLGSIVLKVAQTPDGETTHQIWVSDEPIGGLGLKLRANGPPVAPAPETDKVQPVPDASIASPPTLREIRAGIGDRSKAKLVHSFEGYTKQGQSLRFDFPSGTQARYVQILTTRSPSWVAWSEIVLWESGR
jgi:RNA polymerase sigma factor (sigma-70 family)